MQSTDVNNFFQSDRDLLLQQKREEKKNATLSLLNDSSNADVADVAGAAAPAAAGTTSIFQMPSKILAMLFVQTSTSQDMFMDLVDRVQDNSDPIAYVGESGHVARRVNLKTGKPTHTYKGHSGPVTSLALQYNQDGTEGHLFTGSWDKTIRKWDPKSGETLATFSGHADFVKCLVIHGTTLFSGSSDSTIKTWNIETGECKATWKGHTRAVEALSLIQSEEGDVTLYSGSSDTSIRQWDMATGSYLRVLKGHLTSVYGLYWLEGDLWSVSADKAAKRWDLEKGSATTSLTHPDFVKSLTVWGPYVITGCRDEQVRVFNRATDKLVNAIDAHFGEISCVEVYKGRLWTGSLDGTIRAWTMDDLKVAPGSSATKAPHAATAADIKPTKYDFDSKGMTEEEERELAELMDM